MIQRKDEDWKYELWCFSLPGTQSFRVFRLIDAKIEAMRVARLYPDDNVQISDKDGHTFRSYYMEDGKLIDCRFRYITKVVG